MGAAKMPANDSPLNPKQQRFVDEYIKDSNATQAAIRAGYSAKTANEQGARLFANVSVRAIIDKRLQEISEKAGVTAERLLREVGALALSDARKILNDDGTVKSPAEWDDATAAAVASIKVKEIRVDDSHIGQVVEVKLWDKNSAAEKLMRHLGLFSKDNAQKVDPLTELLALVAERSQRLPIKE